MSRYAIVINNIVDNVIVSNPHNASQIAKSKGGISVYADRYPIQATDTCTDGKFYRDGVEILRTPTAEELIAKQQQEINAQNEYLLDLDFRQSLSELGV